MNFLQIILNNFGRYIEKRTTNKEIENLIKRLNPIKCRKKLIRLGDDNDGGYIVPDDFQGIKYCFSAGVGDLIKFEKDCSRQYGIKCYLCDFNNIKNKEIIDYFDFTKKKISSYNDKKNITINTWIKKKIKLKHDLILKIDIEGSEYETILNLDENILKRTRILIIEFHRLRDLRNKFFYNIFNNTISKLLNLFYVVHLHPNNSGKMIKIGKFEVPDLIEITLIRKNRILKKKKNNNLYPLEIDQKNIKSKKDIILKPYWY